MIDEIELQGDETALVKKRNNKQRIWFIIPPLLLLGGFGVWLLWPISNDVVEEARELADLPAATAPPIVPQADESTTDVPAAPETTTVEDPALAGPAYIPPAVDDTPISSEAPDLPVIDPFQTTPYDERRSRFQDALTASPIVEFEEIPTEDAVGQSGSPLESNDIPAEQYTLTPGAVIPSVLMQGINTDLPGIAVAQVSRDVYDSRTGTRLLIPRGSRVFGTYGSEPVVSDQRVLVSWERIDLPNGGVIDLGNVIGADQSGNAGLKDQIRRGTGKALTVTGLTSLITAGLTQAANANDPEVLRETGDGRFIQEPSYRAEATREVARQYGEIVAQIARRHLEQGTTLTIRPGYEFAIQIVEEISLNRYIR